MYGKSFTCGDTHSYFSETQKLFCFDSHNNVPLTKKDVVFQLGDFQWLWKPLGEDYEQDYCLDVLASKPYSLAIVLGNHENYALVNLLPTIKKWGGEVKVLSMPSGDIFFLARGGAYFINGQKILAIGGATSRYREPELVNVSWWEEENITEKEMEFCKQELKRNDYSFDYVLTHTCPKKFFLSEIEKQRNLLFNDCLTSTFLCDVYDSISFSAWHFAHLHYDEKFSFENKDFFCHFKNSPFLISNPL